MGFSKALVLLTALSLLAACGSSVATVDVSSAEASSAGTAATAESAGSASLVTAPGDYVFSFNSQGMDRPFILHVPPAYDGIKNLPLVYILHGGEGSAKSMILSTGMSEKADQEGFLVAYLNGTGDKPQWNCGLFPDEPTVDDVAFLRDLTEALKASLRVDPARIYAAGFSNGAMMAHRLGAELADVLAGVAAVEGTIGALQADGTYKTIATPIASIPVLMIHGEQDPVVPYDGGSDGNPRLSAKSVADAVTFWTEADGCTGSPVHHVSNDGNIRFDDDRECAAGAEVALISIGNGRHQWPTLDDQTHFPATEAIWNFFSHHARTR